jgi:hypothetical protein
MLPVGLGHQVGFGFGFGFGVRVRVRDPARVDIDEVEVGKVDNVADVDVNANA